MGLVFAKTLLAQDIKGLDINISILAVCLTIVLFSRKYTPTVTVRN